MDRSEEFTEILKNKTERDEKEEATGTVDDDKIPILRSRAAKKKNEEIAVTEISKESKESKESNNTIFHFSKSFLCECTLTNSTLLQLNEKLGKISQKTDQISFSMSSSSNNPTGSIEEALNICSMNVSILGKQLNDKIEYFEGKEHESSYYWPRSLKKKVNGKNPIIMEHCKLVLSFLQNRIGKITEDLEALKTRKKNRESLLNNFTKKSSNLNFRSSSSSTNTSSFTTTTSDNDQMMLQVENSRMIEEMSRGLLETLSTTESQVLQVSRLQSTLQSHLTVQHDLTCRLFEDSINTVQDTRKGNEYLRRAGKEGSVMRRFLVTLILGMSALILLLHYFNRK